MVSKEEFEIEKAIVDWLMNKGITFDQAIAVISYCYKTDKTIIQAYYELVLNGYKFAKKEIEQDESK